MWPTVVAKAGAHPQDSSGEERAEYRTGGADQRDIPGPAITDLMAEPRPEPSAHQDGDDDPGGEPPLLHGHILASPVDGGHLDPPTLAG